MDVSDFKFGLRNRMLDWKKFSSVNIEQLMANPDFVILQDNLLNVAFCDVNKEFDLSGHDSNFIKLFMFSQLIIEYLLYTQESLLKKIENDVEIIEKLEKECLVNTMQIDDLKIGLKKSEEESHNRKKLLKKQQKLMNLGSKAGFRCAFCKDKTFINEGYWTNHMLNRHYDKMNEFKLPDPEMSEQLEMVKKENMALNEELQKLQKNLENELESRLLLKKEMDERETELKDTTKITIEEHKKEIEKVQMESLKMLHEANLKRMESQKELAMLLEKQANKYNYEDVNQSSMADEIIKENERLKEYNVHLKKEIEKIESMPKIGKGRRSKSRGTQTEQTHKTPQRSVRTAPGHNVSKLESPHSRSKSPHSTTAHEIASRPKSPQAKHPRPTPRQSRFLNTYNQKKGGHDTYLEKEDHMSKPHKQWREKLPYVPVHDYKNKDNKTEAGALMECRNKVQREHSNKLLGENHKSTSNQDEVMSDNEYLEKKINAFERRFMAEVDKEQLAALRMEVESEMFLILKGSGVESKHRVDEKVLERATRLLNFQRHNLSQRYHGFSSIREDLIGWLELQVGQQMPTSQSYSALGDLLHETYSDPMERQMEPDTIRDDDVLRMLMQTNRSDFAETPMSGKDNMNYSNLEEMDKEKEKVDEAQNENDISEWEDVSDITEIISSSKLTSSYQAPQNEMPILESDAASDVSSILLTEGSSYTGGKKQ